ncbi:hypothetical protein [Spirosoma radiotolerans]|nr:hypothetical protein [Spirosoma radiotolerans]
MKIRIIVTTSLTTTDLQNIAAWSILLSTSALFWYGVVKFL